MSDKRRDDTAHDELRPDDLCVPVYLDQAMVFDLLAFVEDGLYQLETVTTSIGEADSRRGGVNASLGTSNVFSFLRVGLGGERSNERSSTSKEERQRELVYTPASLFAKLRLRLRRKGLITDLSSVHGINSLEAGNLIEFRGVLNENPAIASIETPVEFGKFIRSHGVLEGESEPTGTSSTRAARHRKSARGAARNEGTRSAATREQPDDSSPKDILSTLEALTAADERELLCDITSKSSPVPVALISTRAEFFSGREIQVLFGWDVRVLGHIVRVVRPDDEAINLVRRTPIGRVPSVYTELLEEWISRFREMDLRIPGGSTLEVPGPAVHVKAIAIFL